jgi:hypothetical protein
LLMRLAKLSTGELALVGIDAASQAPPLDS